MLAVALKCLHGLNAGEGIGGDGPDPSVAAAYTARLVVPKSQTGFAGLYNQGTSSSLGHDVTYLTCKNRFAGATCYLNSFVQSLYMNPEFRASIYQWRYDSTRDGAAEFSILLQLQQLFAKMQVRPCISRSSPFDDHIAMHGTVNVHPF